MLIKYISYPRLRTALKKDRYMFCQTKDKKLMRTVFGVLRKYVCVYTGRYACVHVHKFFTEYVLSENSSGKGI